ncbi:Isn1 [Kluyveromyces lactis]|nr:Isn1 [Kluyveromyces lactis]
MSSRYRVEYNLKVHKKDAFIEWIKGLLAVPFVLQAGTDSGAERTYKQYCSIFSDIENLVSQKIEIENRRRELGSLEEARLDQLVPQVGTFFTHLPLVEAFEVQNRRRAICSRKMVSPSFNDIRHILNSAQILALLKSKELKLVTFDGDVTLYEDGGSIERGGKIVTRIITLLKRGINVGVVTAAGYDDPDKYKERLYGLCFALFSDKSMSLEQKSKLTVMGGESNYLFQYFETSEQFGFKSIDDDEWVPPSVKAWSDDDIDATLDVAQKCFGELSHLLALPSKCQIIRKKRAVGFVPGFIFDDELEVNVKIKIPREALEEMVLVVQKKLESYPPAQNIQFSCFDGGSDVWCDIGGKDLGVSILQNFYQTDSPITAAQTLHIGDQFAPKGSANDFKARSAGCTLWISSPSETIEVLDDLLPYL